MNAVDGAEVIDLVDVAGDAERTHDFARRAADELPAAFEEQRPIRKLGKRLHEGRLLFCLLQPLPRGSIERERREGLAVGDLETHERSAILLLECLHPSAGIEHDRSQRMGFALPGRDESTVDDLVRLGERDRAHLLMSLCLAGSGAPSRAAARAWVLAAL